MTEQQPGTSVVKSDDTSELETIRQAGAVAVSDQRAIARLADDLGGLKWGGVSGASMSPGAKNALAEFCHLTGANPLTHIHILGDNLYLNAAYYRDLVTSHPRFHHDEQIDVSPSVDALLRDQADRYFKRAKDAEGEQAQRFEARGHAKLDEADEVETERARWSPRSTATVVIVTEIYRFTNQAPLDGITAGSVDPTNFLVVVRECNWAGGKPADGKRKDPIGNEDPATSARSRSYRRCGQKAFSAWMAPHQERLDRAAKVIEAEFVILEHDESPLTLSDSDAPPMLSVGSGEAHVATDSFEQLPEEPVFDARDAQKRLFATLRDSGITNKELRSAWCEENRLPDSTKDWTAESYERAQSILVDPVKADVLERAGDSVSDMALRILQKDYPEYLRDWLALKAALDADRSADEEEEADDEDLELNL